MPVAVRISTEIAGGGNSNGDAKRAPVRPVGVKQVDSRRPVVGYHKSVTGWASAGMDTYRQVGTDRGGHARGTQQRTGPDREDPPRRVGNHDPIGICIADQDQTISVEPEHSENCGHPSTSLTRKTWVRDGTRLALQFVGCNPGQSLEVTIVRPDGGGVICADAQLHDVLEIAGALAPAPKGHHELARRQLENVYIRTPRSICDPEATGANCHLHWSAKDRIDSSNWVPANRTGLNAASDRTAGSSSAGVLMWRSRVDWALPANAATTVTMPATVHAVRVLSNIPTHCRDRGWLIPDPQTSTRPYLVHSTATDMSAPRRQLPHDRIDTPRRPANPTLPRSTLPVLGQEPYQPPIPLQNSSGEFAHV